MPIIYLYGQLRSLNREQREPGVSLASNPFDSLGEFYLLNDFDGGRVERDWFQRGRFPVSPNRKGPMMATTKNEVQEVPTEAAPVEETTEVVDPRKEFADAIVSMMETIAPILIDLIHGDYMVSRSETPATITAEREALENFIGLMKTATQGSNGYDKQLERARNIYGSDFVKDVKPFRAPKPAKKAAVDGAKILSGFLKWLIASRLERVGRLDCPFKETEKWHDGR